MHCDPPGQKNLPLLQQKAFRAVFYSEFQIISSWPSALTPPLLDELTSFGQRESASAILGLYCWSGLWLCWNSGHSQLCLCDAPHSFDKRPTSGSQCVIWNIAMHCMRIRQTSQFNVFKNILHNINFKYHCFNSSKSSSSWARTSTWSWSCRPLSQSNSNQSCGFSSTWNSARWGN